MQLSPGTFSDVLWPVERPYPTLFVPSTAIATNLQRTFIIRVRGGKAEWVDVKPGAAMGALTEVFGELQAGDEVVVHGTDAVRAGSRISSKLTLPQ